MSNAMFEVTVNDATEIAGLINEAAERGEMLHRSVFSVFEALPEFVVVKAEGKVIGCCSYRIFGAKDMEPIAEIRSLVVKKEFQHQGYGDFLIREVFKEIANKACGKIFVLTYVPKFFEDYGFKVVDKKDLPQERIWRECRDCRLVDNCKEVPMIKETE